MKKTSPVAFALHCAANMVEDEANACLGDIVPGDLEGAKLAQARASALFTAAEDIRAMISKKQRD